MSQQVSIVWTFNTEAEIWNMHLEEFARKAAYSLILLMEVSVEFGVACADAEKNKIISVTSKFTISKPGNSKP